MNNENEPKKGLEDISEWQQIEKECKLIESLFKRMDPQMVPVAAARLLFEIVNWASRSYWEALGLLQDVSMEYRDAIMNIGEEEEEEENDKR